MKNFKSLLIYFIATLLVAIIIYLLIMVVNLSLQIEDLKNHLIYLEDCLQLSI